MTFKLDYYRQEGLPTFLSAFDPLLSSLAPLGILGLHKFLPYRRWFREELSSTVMERLSTERVTGGAMVEERGTGNVCPGAHFGTRKSCARAKCRSHPRSYRPPLAERNPESSLCRAPRSNPGGSLTKDTLKGDLPVLVEADRPRGANSFLRPFSRLTMPLKQLSRVYPAASGGLLARAAGDRAVERAGDSSTALFRICLLTGGDDRSYALGMACALAGQGISVDFIGSDKLDAPELHRTPLIAFLNLRGAIKTRMLLCCARSSAF